MYNYWAILGLDIFAIVFWITSFSVLAARVATYKIVTYSSDECTFYYYGYCLKKRSLEERATAAAAYTYRNSMAAASGLGGLELYVHIAYPVR
jgi:hypothetical protein